VPWSRSFRIATREAVCGEASSRVRAHSGADARGRPTMKGSGGTVGDIHYSNEKAWSGLRVLITHPGRIHDRLIAASVNSLAWEAD
jgi:hypothetical protein